MGFKELTANNWDEPDEASALFTRLSPIAGFVKMNGNDWARLFLAVALDETVPSDIRDLFAVARGTLLYGWFFYPLYNLGDEQLHRVADIATAARYRQLGGPPTKRGQLPPFKRRIEWLVEQGTIPEDMLPRWEAIRDLRNIGTHPDFQQLHPPGESMTTLTIIAESVNELFR